MALTLPSLGATTQVPGAAGAPTVAGPAMGGAWYGDDGMLHVVIGGAKEAAPSITSNPFGATFEKLFGMTPEQSFAKLDEKNASDQNSGGDEIIDAPMSIPGNLDDALEWLKNMAPALLMVGAVVLLSLYGLSAATRR